MPGDRPTTVPNDGLTSAEAEVRLVRFGPNEPAATQHYSLLCDLWRAITNPLVVILLLAPLLSASLAERTDAAIIVVIILLSTTIDLVQANRSRPMLISVFSDFAGVRQGRYTSRCSSGCSFPRLSCRAQQPTRKGHPFIMRCNTSIAAAWEQTFQLRCSIYRAVVVGVQMSKKNGLADPSRLKSFDRDDKRLLRVVIETPKGSRNKFAFDPDEQVFQLKRVLPSGMEFPYDFGFVPSTKADDGDPIDVLVLMDEPAFPGCVLSCRPIGVIEGEQGEGKKTERNDRVVAVQRDAHDWADIRTINDLGKQFRRELEEFFVNYHKLAGEEYRVLGIKGPDVARKIVKAGRR